MAAGPFETGPAVGGHQPPDWPDPPPGWVYWVPADGSPPGTPQPSSFRVPEESRRGLVLETWFVQVAFLVPSVLAAVDLLAAHTGGAAITRFPTIVTSPVANLILGVLTYLSVAAVVPIALLLLSRTGQDPADLGLGRPMWRLDVWPGLGIAASGYGVSVLAAIALTAIAEETLVSGYLLTRLEQLGWNPRWALLLSLTLRTSYHVYYGLGFLLTIPFGYFATRSFQKHRRLTRPIVAHFLYDAVLITISVLVS